MDFLKPAQPEIEKDKKQESAECKLGEMMSKVDISTVVDIISEFKKTTFETTAEEESFRIQSFRLLKSRVDAKSSRKEVVAEFVPGLTGGPLIRFSADSLPDNYPEFLHALFHELSHFVSVNKSTVEPGLEVVNRDFEGEYSPLNEAFTEFFADAILQEYLKRTGQKLQLDENFDKRLKTETGGYSDERFLLNRLIDDISEESGVERDVVVRAFLGHYLRADFNKILEEFTDLSGKKVVDRLDSLKNFNLGVLDTIKIVMLQILKDGVRKTENVQAITKR